MTRVELSNVPHDAPMQKTIIEIPDDQWARMTNPSGDTGGITRTITTSYDGTRVVVDAHRGGSVIVWRELLTPCEF